MVEEEKVIEEIRREIEEIKASLPAHSTQPSQLLRLEELEEKLAALTGEDSSAPA